MKKLLCIGLISLFLSGCTAKLDENFDEAVLKEKAIEVVTYLNEDKFEEVSAMGDENMNTPELANKLKEAWLPTKTNFGSFKEFDKFDYTSKDGNAIVIAIASYENNKVQFTISFNSDMKLAGFYFK